MVTGHGLFRGSPAEVMYQHQHAPVPLEQLESVPQPVVTLIEVLLDKNPKRRFQAPAEFLKVLPTIRGAIDEGLYDHLSEPRQMPPGDSYGRLVRRQDDMDRRRFLLRDYPLQGAIFLGGRMTSLS